MAKWRDTASHDPGDENDTNDFLYALEESEKCPFCDEPYSLAVGYLTPVCHFSRTKPVHKTLVDAINTCDAKPCLRIAGDLAKKWEARINK